MLPSLACYKSKAVTCTPKSSPLLQVSERCSLSRQENRRASLSSFVLRRSHTSTRRYLTGIRRRFHNSTRIQVVLDDDRRTYWSRYGVGQWLEFILDTDGTNERVEVEAVEIQFYRGKSRVQYFQVTLCVEANRPSR